MMLLKVDLLPLVLVLCYMQTGDSQTFEKKVVVIGGGISGLAAARRLVNIGQGNFSVQVFEARRERYGGRVWTDKLKNNKVRGLEVDLGGGELYGDFSDNPLLNLTAQLGLETGSYGNVQFVIPWQNKKYSGEEVEQLMVQAGSIIMGAVNTTRTQKKDLSIKEAVDEHLRAKGISEDDLQALFVKTFISYIIPEFSALHYLPDSIDFGYEKVLLDGMGELVDRLVSGSEDERPLKVSLRTAVRQVKVDELNSKVLLRLKDGSQEKADYVIVAVPAPVISKGTLLFDPELPQDYMDALNEMGMVDCNKVIVEFEKPFWSDDYGIYIAAVDQDSDRGILHAWQNLHKFIHKPFLLGGVIGKAAVDFESLSDSEVHDIVRKKLSIVFGEEAVSASTIVSIRRSAWTSDQWSGAASSYTRVGNSPKLWDIFSEPLCPHLFFAGEHTTFYGHGTLHGAYLSGIRAANQILSGYCDQKSVQEKMRKTQEKKVKGQQENFSSETPTVEIKDVEKDEL